MILHLVQKKPILGICLGMQLMSKFSEEGNAKGLGWIDASVKKFKTSDSKKFKIPHMGWNTIHLSKKSSLMKGIDEDEEFYFVHSYYVEVENQENSTRQHTLIPFAQALSKKIFLGFSIIQRRVMMLAESSLEILFLYNIFTKLINSCPTAAK